MAHLNLQRASVRQLFETIYTQLPVQLDHTYFWDAGFPGNYQPATKNRRLARQVASAGGMVKFCDPQNRRGIVVHAGFDEVFVLLQQLQGADSEGGEAIKVFRPTDYRKYLLIPEGKLPLLHARWILTHAASLRKLREDCDAHTKADWELPEIIDEVENYVLYRLPVELPQHLSV